MTTATLAPPTALENVADVLKLIERLGGIDPSRVRLTPTPGTATEDDLVRVNERKLGALCELVDGTLVEKVMGVKEADYGGELYGFLREFVRPRKLGKVLPADAMLRVAPGLVRLPDVCFIGAAKWREWQKTEPAVADFGPDLAVEVLSRSNRRAEIERKLREYFAAGAKLVWVIDPRRRTAAVYTSPTAVTRLTEAGELTGGDVLPGFRLTLAELFVDPLA